MSRYLAKGNLSSTTESVIIDVPNDADYHVIARVSGTFVGTLQIQTSTDLGANYSARQQTTVSNTTQGTITGVGVYGALATTGADYAKVVFSAYTSGTATVELLLVPVSA